MLALAIGDKGEWVISLQRADLLKGYKKFPGISCCFKATCISNGWERGWRKWVLLLGLPKTCQNFACFFVNLVTAPAGLPITLNRKRMNMPSLFQFENVPWWGQTWLCLFSLGNKSGIQSLLFKPRKTSPHSQVPEERRLNLELWTWILPRKGYAFWNCPEVEICLKPWET